MVGGEIVDGHTLPHKGKLLQNHQAALLLMDLALHGLRHPVGVGELLERIKVRILNDGDGVKLQGPGRQVGNPDVADLTPLAVVASQGHKDGDIGTDAMELGYDPGVTQSHATFIAVVGIERRHKIGRKDSVAISLLESEVKGFPSELRTG